MLNYGSQLSRFLHESHLGKSACGYLIRQDPPSVERQNHLGPPLSQVFDITKVCFLICHLKKKTI